MRFKAAIPVLAAFALGACQDMNILDPNQPTLTSLTGNPTPAALAVAAQGVLLAMRDNATGIATTTGTLAREFLPLNSQEPRPYNENLKGPVNNASQGGGQWAGWYTIIRQGWITLDGTDAVQGMSNADKAAIRGFVKTWMAVALGNVIDMRADNGAVIDTHRDPFGDPGPLEPQAKVQDAVMAQFDEAIADLKQAGAAFPFKMPPGFAGFTTPSQFLKVAYALKTRYALHFKRYDVAEAALAQSFIDDKASLDLGPFYNFSTGPGETANAIFRSAVNYGHRSIVLDAEMKAGTGTCTIDTAAQCDDRVARNVYKTTAKTLINSTSDLYFTKYDNGNRSYPVIRNEELILDRAEIAIQKGAIAAAAADINLIRTKSGGLQARNDLTADNILNELIRQRRYSLFLENDYWLLLRRYGKLSILPKDGPDHIIITKYPIPNAECLARGGQTSCAAAGATPSNQL